MELYRKYDVAVCGGGIAGIAAALAAAESGASVCMIEKEYAPGGLATLGLIAVYLPLCDGDGVQMSGGLCETLIKAAFDCDVTSRIPEAWRNPDAAPEERRRVRYQAEYNPNLFIIAAERLLEDRNVKIFYDAKISGAATADGAVTSVYVETKRGRMEIAAAAFVDGTGDADVCWYAGEPTVDDGTNRRTGWYYGHEPGRGIIHLVQQTDPIYSAIPKGSRLYSGTDIDDVSAHCMDMRKMIYADIVRRREQGSTNWTPVMMPAFHGLRMTRRLAGGFEFSEELHERVWFADAIGMIGNWKKCGCRYAIPYRCIRGVRNGNLFAAGRCVSAEKSGWDLTRVIPTCAVTGEAAGAAAALTARLHRAPEYAELHTLLMQRGVLLNPSLFARAVEVQ